MARPRTADPDIPPEDPEDLEEDTRPAPTTLPTPSQSSHTTDPTPGAPTRVMPSQVMGWINEGLNSVYLTDNPDYELPEDRGSVEYDRETDQVYITLNMRSRDFPTEEV